MTIRTLRKPPDRKRLEDLTYSMRGTKPKPRHMKNVEGWDTETLRPGWKARGLAYVVANSQESFLIESWDDVVASLFSHRQRGKKNFWWNLDFDVTALLKWNPEIFYSVTKDGIYEDDKLKVIYIPKKLLKVRIGKNNFTYYDMMQFYNMGLQDAVENVLGMMVHAAKHDRGNLGELTDLEVSEYCISDANFTKILSERYIAGLHKIGLFPRHLISKGNLAQVAVLTHANVSTWHDNPMAVNKIAWESFRGGWFDLYKRGTVKTYKADLKSAYPAELREFPDFLSGKWVPYKDGDIGFCRVVVHDVSESYVPMLSDWNGLAYHYPTFDQPLQTTLTSQEVDFLKGCADVEVLNSWSYVDYDLNIHPWRNVIDRFLSLKEANKDNPEAYLASKEVVNATYGKSCETVERHDGLTYAGKLFNPVVASLITSRTRLKIANATKNCLKDIIMVATDAVASDRPIHGLDIGSNVGQWELEEQGEVGLFLKPGVYEFEGQDPHTRGFKLPRRTKAQKRLKMRPIKSLRTLCESCDDDKFPVTWTMAHSSRQAIHRNKYSIANLFVDVTREIKLEDTRRLWIDDPTSWKELAQTCVESMPIPSSLTC